MYVLTLRHTFQRLPEFIQNAFLFLTITSAIGIVSNRVRIVNKENSRTGADGDGDFGGNGVGKGACH
jgi:hypothetical protein